MTHLWRYVKIDTSNVFRDSPVILPLYNVTLYGNCSDGDKFALYVLNMCVLNAKQKVAMTFGIISIISWILYALPQIWENFRKGIADVALSPWLLAFWLVGDAFNMIGAVLTKQLILQIVMSAFAIFCDILLIGQYGWSFAKHKSKKEDSKRTPIKNTGHVNYGYNSSNLTEDPKAVSSTTILCSFLLFIGIFGLSMNYSSYENRFKIGSGRKLLSSSSPISHSYFFRGSVDITGYALGCISTLFYISGRIPQILKNFQRQATEGLSITLFILAILGNLTYGLQIIITSLNYLFILRDLPWILGSLGVMTLDIVILSQFFIYKRSQTNFEVLEEASEV